MLLLSPIPCSPLNYSFAIYGTVFLCAYLAVLPVFTTVTTLSVPSSPSTPSLSPPSFNFPSLSQSLYVHSVSEIIVYKHITINTQSTRKRLQQYRIYRRNIFVQVCACANVCVLVFLHIFTCNNLWNGNCLWHIISIMLPVRPSFILICLQSTHTHTKAFTHTPFIQPVSINCHLHKINIKTAGNNNNNKCLLNPSENF